MSIDFVGALPFPTWILIGLHPVEIDAANSKRVPADSPASIRPRQMGDEAAAHRCARCAHWSLEVNWRPGWRKSRSVDFPRRPLRTRISWKAGVSGSYDGDGQMAVSTRCTKRRVAARILVV